MYIWSQSGLITLRVACVPFKHVSYIYTPGIRSTYVEGYIVFGFPSIRSFIHSSICLFIRVCICTNVNILHQSFTWSFFLLHIFLKAYTVGCCVVSVTTRWLQVTSFCWCCWPKVKVTDLENSVMFMSKFCLKFFPFAYIFESSHFRMLMCG